MKKMGIATVYGLVTIYIIIAIFSLLFSLLLKFTSLEEASLNWFILGLSFLALFIGGFVSGGKGKEKGWLMGSATGLLFTSTIFLFQYLGHDVVFTKQQLLYHLGFIGAAIFGGIFGVNMSTPSRKEM